MTTVPTRSWRATTVRRWKRCFWTSRADGCGRARRDRDRGPSRDLGASHQRDGAALLVSPDVVVAAASGADLLAGAADHHLGLPAELHLADFGILRARRRLADRRRHPVGHSVPRPARLFDLVPRGDVGAQPRQFDDEPVKADRVLDLADGDEPDPARDRRDPDDAARAVFLRLQLLRHRPAADRLLLQSDLHQLVDRDLCVGPCAAQRAGRRKHRLDADVRPDAARLHLLSGVGAAGLAAISGVDAAAYLCVRGHAGAIDGSRVSGRPDGVVARHQRGALYRVICDLSCPFAQRQTPRFFARGWRISHYFPVDFRGFRVSRRVDIQICALTHYYAFGTMLRRKTEVRIQCRLVSLAVYRRWWPKAVRRLRRRCTGSTKWATRRSIRHAP